MEQMYAMRRANGDWFAMDKQGRLHVPVFKSLSAALLAHWRNPGMMLFKPAVLDERALKELAPTDKSSTVGFWLVNDPTALPSHGSPLEHAQLALLIPTTTKLPTR